MDFIFTIFKPLKPEDFVVLLPDALPEERDKVFIEWLADFYHRATVFYNAASISLKRWAEAQFREIYRIPEGDDFAYVQYEWEAFKRKSAVYQQVIKLEDEIDTSQQARARVQSLLPPKDPYAGRLNPEPSLIKKSKIWQYWFNKTINNSPEEQARLHELEYSQYLQTEHWRTVRNAMLLSYQARCQELSCRNIGDSWYGVEADIHVHHLSYANKGNERFLDLTLLCDRHHRLWHENDNNGLPQTVIIEVGNNDI